MCNQFLQVNLNYLGHVPLDNALRKAVRQQQAVLELYPASPSSRSLTRLAERLDRTYAERVSAAGPQSGSPTASIPSTAPGSAEDRGRNFWDRLLHWKKAR